MKLVNKESEHNKVVETEKRAILDEQTDVDFCEKHKLVFLVRRTPLRIVPWQQRPTTYL